MSQSEEQEVALLKKELLGLFNHIQLIRTEIASIRHPGGDEDHFSTMADQLDAIVVATEQATDTIMESVEGVEDILAQVRGKTEDPEILSLLDQASDKNINVFEACSFQDLTGQRVTKVVESVKFIEERVNSLISIWGKDKLAELPSNNIRRVTDSKDDEHRMLHGPQRAVNQQRVDQLFGGEASEEDSRKEESEADRKAREEAERKRAEKEKAEKAEKEKKAASAKKEEKKAEEKKAEEPASGGGGGGDAPQSQDDVDKLFDESEKEVSQDDIDKLFG